MNTCTHIDTTEDVRPAVRFDEAGRLIETQRVKHLCSECGQDIHAHPARWLCVIGSLEYIAVQAEDVYGAIAQALRGCQTCVIRISGNHAQGSVARRSADGKWRPVNFSVQPVFED